jgi:hypothetical protein
VIPLYILFPVLVLVMWGAGFVMGMGAQKQRQQAAAAPLDPYPAPTGPQVPLAPPWPEYEAVVYPVRPGARHRVPRRLGVIPRRAPGRPAAPARYSHEKVTT